MCILDIVHFRLVAGIVFRISVHRLAVCEHTRDSQSRSVCVSPTRRRQTLTRNVELSIDPKRQYATEDTGKIENNTLTYRTQSMCSNRIV